MVEEIRYQWCDLLENLLQCPVCFIIPEESTIINFTQCLNGHHICSVCRAQTDGCPLCKSVFTNTRNFLAENLCEKFEDMKKSLLDPYHIINRRFLKGKVCVSTQTETIEKNLSDGSTQTKPFVEFVNKTHRTVAIQSDDCDNNNTDSNIKDVKGIKKQFNFINKIGKGLYPCRIDSCAFQTSYGRMMNHLRYYHERAFSHFQLNDDGIFSQEWILEYTKSINHDIALFIERMGLFFLNITIHDNGDLTACVQIVNSASVGRLFTCKIQVGKDNRVASYSGMVRSCRLNREFLSEDCLYVRTKGMNQITYGKNFFHCSLVIHHNEANIQCNDLQAQLGKKLE